MASSRDEQSATAGRRIYAVGDIHGRIDCLLELLTQIMDDKRSAPPATRPLLIFLGDYVDRGADTRLVLETLVGLQAAADFEIVVLKGNHEAFLLAFLEDAARGPEWASYGGLATLKSYGVSSPEPQGDGEGWRETQAALKCRMPLAHRRLLERMPILYVVGAFAFVHAGIRPGLPIESQSERDLLWIREPFLASNIHHEKIIVHGHTPVETPFNGPYRINVDTGAYATGVLTAVRLEGSTREFLYGSTRSVFPSVSRQSVSS